LKDVYSNEIPASPSITPH